MKSFLVATFLTIPLLHAAHPGKGAYELYCGACHGPDGKGINNGQFPPLAGSEWVKGDPKRIIEIVLHGLQGKMEVAGKGYDLVMPPHKASLKDDQIADIISYVRSSWGHKESAVTKEQVIAMRKAGKDQVDMVKADDLLKKYPLTQAGAINDLLSFTHIGDFKSLKDLRKSKAINAEEEASGLISLKQAALGEKPRDGYGLVWTGWVEAPKTGRYTFYYDTDDGGSLSVNGQEIITRNYIGPAGKPTRKTVKLEKGRVELKIEYFEASGQEFCALAWEGPGLSRQSLSETKLGKRSPKKRSNPSIPIVAPEGEATIYRNFIAGTDPRGIGVGYSEGVNLAFSADSISLDMIWKGKFIDAGRHWTNRGQGFEPPAETEVVTVNRGFPFAILESQTSSWPEKPNAKIKPRFRGYQLNEKQQPGFAYQIGSTSVMDLPIPGKDGNSFTRTLIFQVAKEVESDAQLYFRALSGRPATAKGEREFLFDDSLTLKVPDSDFPPFLRDDEVLIPVPTTPGRHKITLSYTLK